MDVDRALHLRPPQLEVGRLRHRLDGGRGWHPGWRCGSAGPDGAGPRRRRSTGPCIRRSGGGSVSSGPAVWEVEGIQGRAAVVVPARVDRDAGPRNDLAVGRKRQRDEHGGPVGLAVGSREHLTDRALLDGAGGQVRCVRPATGGACLSRGLFVLRLVELLLALVGSASTTSGSSSGTGSLSACQPSAHWVIRRRRALVAQLGHLESRVAPHGMGTVVLCPVARSMTRRMTGRTQTTCSTASSRMTSFRCWRWSCHVPQTGEGCRLRVAVQARPEAARDLGPSGEVLAATANRAVHGRCSSWSAPPGDLVGVVEPGQIDVGRRPRWSSIGCRGSVRCGSCGGPPGLDHGHEGRLGA